MDQGLAAVLHTHLLRDRPSRGIDPREGAAVATLVRAVVQPPDVVLHQACELALELCGGHSAGVAVLSGNNEMEAFTRPAIVGAWSHYVNSSAPRSFSPYGIVVDRNAPQLFRQPHRYYTYVADVRPPIEEVLLAPFSHGGIAVGALWVVLHDDSKQFDAEDERLLNNLARCMSAVHQVALSLARLSEPAPPAAVATALFELDDVLAEIPTVVRPWPFEASLRRRLSEREFQVVRLVAQGHTNRAIADMLAITVKSVETYRARAADKAGFRTRADFVHYALTNGLLQEI